MHQSRLQHLTHEHITLTSIERQVILVGNCSFLNGLDPVILRNATPPSDSARTRSRGTTTTLRVLRSKRNPHD